MVLSGDIIGYYAERFLAPQHLPPRSKDRKQPVRRALGAQPWNFALTGSREPGGSAAGRAGQNEDEAVALANDSEFGLGGSVFTKDVARGRRVASHINTGMVLVNHPSWTAAGRAVRRHPELRYGRALEHPEARMFNEMPSTLTEETGEDTDMKLQTKVVDVVITVKPSKWIRPVLMTLTILATAFLATGCDGSNDSGPHDSGHHDSERHGDDRE